MSEYGIAFLFLVALLLIAAGGIENGRSKTMREAFERGHAVQCPGRIGYYWECEE